MNAPTTLPSGEQAPQGSQLPKMNSTQERALVLLGDGFPPSIVASSVGVTESYISQLMSLDWFASQVQELKFLNLKKHSEMDGMYDDLEDKLIRKLDKLSSLLVKPMDVAKVLQVVNGAKRKGASANQDHTVVQQNIVQLTIPPALFHKFVSNVNNQVVEVQDGSGQSKSLVTAPSGSLERLSREAREAEELSTSIRGNLLEGEISDSSNRSEKTISSEALTKLAERYIGSDPKALVKRLNESGRTSPALTAEDL